MRNVLVVVLMASLSLVVPRASFAQEPARQGIGSGSGAGSGSGGGTPAKTMTATTTAGDTYTVTTQEKPAAKPQVMIEPPRFGRWVSALTNVQIEVTITDQSGSSAPEKKTVSMLVSSGNWGKMRSAASVKPAADQPPTVVELNVDARPFVSLEGPIQMELTLVYRPLGAATTEDYVRGRPLPINQSQTVILQSGKPLVVSQAADPLNDRKITVEVKATVLK